MTIQTAPAAQVAADGVTTSYLDFGRLGWAVALMNNAGQLVGQAAYMVFGQGSGSMAARRAGWGLASRGLSLGR